MVGVKNDSNVGGDDSKFDWDANYVLIQHSDGTLGQYVHLLKGGAAVKLVQAFSEVLVAQQINHSGAETVTVDDHAIGFSSRIQSITRLATATVSRPRSFARMRKRRP